MTSQAEAENVAVSVLEAQFAAEGRVLTAAEKDSIKTSARIIFASGSATNSISYASADFSHNNSIGGGTTGGGTSTFEWSLDLSEFYNQSEHMQVLYWADYSK